MKKLRGQKLIKNVILILTILAMIVLPFIVAIKNVIAISINIATEENNIDELYISLREVNDNEIGYGYKFGNQEKIWSIVTHDDDGNYIGSTNNLYCAQANYGKSWESREEGSLGTRTVVTYNLEYDFNKNLETTPSNIINDMVTGEHFNKILWLVDNMYVPGESNKLQYLEQAGIFYENGIYLYKPESEHDYTDLLYEGSGRYTFTLKDDDIIAIQQAALWYFTNHTDENGDINPDFAQKGISKWLQYTLDGGSTYEPFTNWTGQTEEDIETAKEEGIARNDFSTILFNYFVDEAEEVAELLGDEKYELEKSEVKLWLSTSDGTETGTDNEEQPLLEIHKLDEFDLSLRKVISAVKTNDGADVELNNVYGEDATRGINSDGSIKNIVTGTLEYPDTTATYNHRKDPIVVQEGQIVEYAISIYNEGEADGYATKIVDQLPPISEIRLLNNNDITSKLGNIYSVTFDTNNKVELTLKSTSPYSIPGYDGTTLSYDTITLPCEVMVTPEEENGKILTNIAYISEAFNSETGETIITEIGKDRDSVPAEFPIYQGTENDNNQDGVTYWNPSSPDYGYIGKDSNSTDLSDNNTYYEGLEDDDDFEKIIVMPKKEITVTKQWIDANNQDGKRPEEIKLQLYADGEVIGEEVILTEEEHQTEENTWKYTWAGLAVYSNGEEIVYEVNETEVPEGYDATEEETFIIKNIHTPENTSVTVTKEWDDANNQDGKRPESIKVQLYANGESLGESYQKVLNEENAWKGTWDNLPKNENGNAIKYTVREITTNAENEEVVINDGEKYDENYTATYSEDELTITNTYEPEETSVIVTKGWEDANNQDGKRPESIEVQLYADGVALGEKVTLNSENTWKHEWTGLPKYKNEGTLIVYEVKELTEAGIAVENGGNYDENYKATYETEGNTTKITNTYTPEETSVTVTKEWNDADNQDGKRPESIEVQLYADGVALGEKVALNDENAWKHEWTGLPKYKNEGTLIVYEVKELTEAGIAVENDGNYDEDYKATYETEGNTTKITNTYTPEETSATVTKEWEDAENQDGKRPESIEVQLYADGVALGEKVTLNSENTWKHEWTGLPKYKNEGTTIVYEVKELTEAGVAVENGENYDEDYKATYQIEGNTTKITNAYTPEETSVTVTKEWNDADNQDGKRPESIKVGLYANENLVEEVTITADENGKWEHTWSNLPKYENGVAITYTVDEIEVPTGYGKTIEGYTITNTYIPVTTEITVKKVWEDNNNQDGIRPESITVILKANGEEVDRKTITEEDNWTHTFTNLAEYENGEAITYTVEEIVPKGYVATQNETVENGVRIITITNTHTPETVSKTVLKIWEDNNNQDGIRPNSIEIQLYANGESLGESYLITLTAGEDGIWQDEELKYTWTNLPKNKNGEEIVYTVKEVNIADGYIATYNKETESSEVAQVNKKITVAKRKDMSTVTNSKAARIELASSVMKVAETSDSNEILTITNTHTPEVTQVLVEKLWNDSNNQYKARPTNIKVQLYANGEVSGTAIELNSSNSWKYTWTNLPKKENGQDIQYTVKELNSADEVVENGQKYNENYIATYEQNGNNVKLTNSLLTFDLKLIKYISAVNNVQVPTRLENVDLSMLNKYDENSKKWISTGKYTLEKEPVKLEQNDYVTYTFRIYNEGTYDGYASEISEDIPEGLEFLVVTDGAIFAWDGTEQREITQEVKESGMYNEIIETNSIWGYTQGSTIITTRGLSEELIKGYGQENAEYADIENQIDYKEISVIFKVKEGIAANTVIRNEAAISEDKAVDENGTEVAVEDRDSIPGNTEEEWKKENSEEKYDEEGKWPIYVEDDEDYDNIIIKVFDLSLRKRIAQIKDVDTNKVRMYSRSAKLDTDNSQTNTLYDYYNKYASIPGVKAGDIVTYSLVIYNEGEIDGYASLIIDALPEGLELVSYEPGDGSINDKYGWTLVEGTENVYKTDYLSYEKDTNKGTEHSTILKAYDGEGEASYQEIYIECKVKEDVTPEDDLLNVAQIAEDSDSDGDEITDTDSVPGTSDDEEKWKNEDDLDIEILELKEFDLALRKFITKIENGENVEEVTTRIPQVSYDEEAKQIIYTHPKDALVVHVGDTVIYTLRVYNEGDIDGYASEIKDDIPEYLEYLPEHETNIEHQWEMFDKDGNKTENVEEAVFIKTKHLAKGSGLEEEDSEGSNLIKAFDEEAEINETNPDYKEVEVAFKVKDPNSTEYEIENFAQISEDTDSEGDPIKDRDSETDNGEEEPKEDDEDIEKVKVEYFDLSLQKYVTKVLVNENGVERVIETGNIGDENDIIPHVQVNKKNIDKTVVKFAYTIRVTNEGQIAGEATEITDYVPEGLVFVEEDNELWTNEGNNVISTKQLEGSTLEPGESVEAEVVLRWVNNSENLGAKTNVAEISEDYNEENVPDKDSTPDNKEEEEDDIDDATVLLSVNQGGIMSNEYTKISMLFLSIILVGGILIKKFVL